MKENPIKIHNIAISFVISIMIFVLLLMAHWTLPLVLAITAGTYVASMLLTSALPPMVSGRYKLALTDGKHDPTLQKAFTDACEVVEEMKAISLKVKDVSVRGNIVRLITITDEILKHLRTNAADLESSQHFLTYWLPKSRDISKNYQLIEGENPSGRVMGEAKENTLASLDSLKTIFDKQRNDYFEDDLLNSRIEKQLLENEVNPPQNILNLDSDGK